MANDPEALRRSIRRAVHRLEGIAADLAAIDVRHLTADEWLHARARLGVLAEDYRDSVAEVDRMLGTVGARSRILRYLQQRLGQVVTKEELAGVGGIQEWARRVRELREEDGWVIQSSLTHDALRVGEYVLVLEHPDEDLARSWRLAKEARRLKTVGGSPPPRVRVLKFLQEVFPSGGDMDQLAHVAGSSSAAEQALAALIADGWDIDAVASATRGVVRRLVRIDRAAAERA